MKKTLYQLNSNGRAKVWTVEVVKVDETLSNIVIHHGLEGGKMVEDITPITSGLNAGKKNATSIYEQAVKDAETEYNKKVKKGYVEDKTNIKAKGETHSIAEPMKGYPYHPQGKVMKGKTLDELKLRGETVVFQRKLDGYRIRLKVNKTDVAFYSSGGDILPTFPHIERVIREGYEEFVRSYGISEFFLDGEMYSHGIEGGFNTISSACGTRVHITPEKEELRGKMDFHLFDIISSEPYPVRYKMLYPFIDGPVVLVNNTVIEKLDDETVQQHFERFVAEGYEGLMIRTLDQPYEFKRTKQLTKYKPFVDEEFQVVGFKKSITGETLGSFECKMDDGTLIYPNPMGEIGTDAARLEIWNNREQYVGKWVNCRFMEYTIDGEGNKRVPRHPRARYFRKGKSKD